MIAFVSGEIAALGSGWVVLNVGGLGYRIETTARVAAVLELGGQVLLHTQLIVREDAHTLYGFLEPYELEMFNILLGVNGVGPRSALGVLQELTPEEIVRAVAAEDAKPFQQVSGIGPKSAKLIVVSLAGKLKGFAFAVKENTAAGSEIAEDSEMAHAEQVIVALTGLGWPEKQAAQAVQDAAGAGAGAGAGASAAELLRAALVLLQNR